MSEGLCWEWPSIVVFWGSPFNWSVSTIETRFNWIPQSIIMKGYSRHNSSLGRRQNRAKFENDRISRNGHRIKTTQSNLMILVSFSFADDVWSNDVNKYNTFTSQCTENPPFRFFWDTRYRVTLNKIQHKCRQNVVISYELRISFALTWYLLIPMWNLELNSSLWRNFYENNENPFKLTPVYGSKCYTYHYTVPYSNYWASNMQILTALKGMVQLNKPKARPTPCHNGPQALVSRVIWHGSN